jgi:hypothetical protein
VAARTTARAGGDGRTTLDQAAVFGVAADLAKAGTGDGLRRLEASAGATPDAATLQRIASNDAWRTLDRAAIAVPPSGVATLAERLVPRAPIAADPTPTPVAPTRRSGATKKGTATAKTAAPPAAPAPPQGPKASSRDAAARRRAAVAKAAPETPPRKTPKSAPKKSPTGPR